MSTLNGKILFPKEQTFSLKSRRHFEGPLLSGKQTGSHESYSPLTHFILETPKGVLAKSADPDQMPHNVASDLGLHYFASCSTIFQQKYLN